MQRSVTGLSQLSGRQSQNTLRQSLPHSLQCRRGLRTHLRTLAAEQEVKTLERAASGKEEKASSSAPESNSNLEPLEAEAKAEDSQKEPEMEENEDMYPSRSEMAGGWAGGEVGLQQFIQEAQKEGGPTKEEAKPAKAEARSAEAEKGSQQVDNDPGKYPSKESIGPLSGITGGFAGGEKGVQQYIEKGDVELAPPGRSRPQFSPLIIAGGAAVAAVLGGLLLDDGVKLGEEAVESGSTLPGINLAATPIDDNTRLLLQIAIALFCVVGVSIGVRAVVKQVQEGTGKLAERALDLGKIGAFWIGVFIAVKFVLESS